MCNNYWIFLNLGLIFVVKLQTIAGTDSIRKCSDIIPGPKRSYFIGGGFTCCNDILLEHVLHPKNEYWRKCLSKQHGNYDDDIPSTMWNVYNCELSSAGNLSNNFMYSEFEMFFMKKYPQEIKDKIISRNTSCEIETGTDLTKRLPVYEDCFLKMEQDLCYELSGTKPPPVIDDDSETNTVPDEVACEPVDKLKNPNNTFPNFAQSCCKGEELPYPLFDLFMDFDRFDVAEEVGTCVLNLRTKLQELKHPKDESLNISLSMCQVACVHEADGLKGKYNTNFKDLIAFKMKSVSNGTKAALLTIIQKYSPQFQLHGSNETVPMESAGSVIAKMDEANQILNYCKFQFEAAAEAYRALYEHCYNEEYGKQFQEEILNSSSKRKLP